jgi:hypothetical protein
MKFSKFILLVSVLGVLFAGCQSATPQLPTSTTQANEQPTDIQSPTQTEVEPTSTVMDILTGMTTPVPQSSPTPIPTNPDVVQEILAGRFVDYPGGFSFRAPVLYGLDMNSGQIVLWEQNDKIEILLQGKTYDDPAGIPAEDVLPGILEKISSRISGFQAAEPFPVDISGIPGQAVDYMVENPADPLIGRIYTVEAGPNQSFLAMAFVPNEANSQLWEEKVAPLMEGIIQSIQFLDPSTIPSSCVISTDESYGFTKENPIKIGDGLGGSFKEGVLISDPTSIENRIRAYFETLRGPDGQQIRYERRGESDLQGYTVDEFAISYTGKLPVSVYVDLSQFEDPAAPVGFSCSGPFPLGAP